MDNFYRNIQNNIEYYKKIQGRVANRNGKEFERKLEISFEWYKMSKLAIVEKNPEPMKPAESLGNGKFIAYFEGKAQVDYKGVILGGKTVVFEAKFTTSDRIEQKRVKEHQSQCLEGHQSLGAICAVIVGFGTGNVYKVPWSTWRDMKKIFGRNYATEKDLSEYKVMKNRSGILLLLD